MNEPRIDVLEKRFDPTGWQTEQFGKVYQIENLSRNDLIQLVCEGMQAVEMLDRILGKANDVMEDWRVGRIQPDPHPSVCAADQIKAAVEELDCVLVSNPKTKKAQEDLRKIEGRLRNVA